MNVTAVATISLDGRITPPGGEGTSFSSAETGAHFFSLLNEADAVISGRRTFDVVKQMMLSMMDASSGPALSIVMTRSPAAHDFRSQPEGLEFTSLGARELLDDLERRGIDSVLVAGGAEVYAAFAASHAVDEWIIVVEPVLLGGGTPLLAFVAHQELSLVECRTLNTNTVLLRYRVEGPSS